MGDSNSMSGPLSASFASTARSISVEPPGIEVIDLESPNKPADSVPEKSPNEFLNVSSSEVPTKPLLPKLAVENGTRKNLKSKTMSQLNSGPPKSRMTEHRRAITNDQKMEIAEVIAKTLNFPVQELADDVKKKRDALHAKEREVLQKIHSKEAIDAEIADIKKVPTMRIPFTLGLYLPDSVTAQLNGKSKKSAECLVNNIIKPYKWYEIDHVIIDSKDHKAIVDSNKKELWYLRIGFVFLIGAVIFYIVYFAIFYSEKSGSAEYEREKTNIVNGVKFGITVWMSLIMFACNKTTNARDSILANHLKTAVDVVRRVEKERWCGSHEPLALPILQRLGEARTNASRVSWTA